MLESTLSPAVELGSCRRFFSRSLFLSFVALCFLTAHAVAAPVVLFDESHGQQFLIGKSGPLDLSELAALYQANGFVVSSQSGTLTKEVLMPVDVLVLSGPFLLMAKSELDAVLDFVDAGGGLAIMLHIAPPVGDLLHRLEVDFTNGTLRETNQVIDGNPLNFKVTALADHPITTGLEGFSVYGSWALRGTAPQTRILAETSPHGWVDLDRDNQLSQNDAVQKFGVMVAGEAGRGRYVVLADDAVFQNRFLDEANRQLAIQLMSWLAYR